MSNVYLQKFILPINKEEWIVDQIMLKNGGIYGYIDNPYPCGIFRKKEFEEINLSPITILYSGNGSGKSTLLKLISSRLQLNRIAPFNVSETYDLYASQCEYQMGYDEEGFIHRIPDGSRIITSDDVFDYMLTMRTANANTSERREEAVEEHEGLSG